MRLKAQVMDEDITSQQSISQTFLKEPTFKNISKWIIKAHHLFPISMILAKSETSLGFHLFCFNTIGVLLVLVLCVLLSKRNAKKLMFCSLYSVGLK